MEFPQYQIKSSKKRPVEKKRDGRVIMRAVEQRVSTPDVA
jgi:hypothetical protein